MHPLSGTIERALGSLPYVDVPGWETREATRERVQGQRRIVDDQGEPTTER